MLIFKQEFLVSLSAGNAVSKFKRWKKMQNFPGVATSPRSGNCLGQTQHVRQHLGLLIFFPICNSFPNISQCRLAKADKTGNSETQFF